MRIIVSTALLSPYRVDWLNELEKYAEIDILYLEECNSQRKQEWLAKRPKNCSYHIMKGKKIPIIGKISFSVIEQLKKDKYDIVILDGYGFVTQIINMLYLNHKKRCYFVNVDGIIPKKKENSIFKAIKKTFLAKIPYFLCGSKATNKILIGYGSNNKKIINHPFSSLYSSDIYANPADETEKKILRKKLGITEEYIIISVGRFSYMDGYGKGYDVLLRAAQQLSKNIGWYIVGGEPTEKFEKMTIDADLSNVHYVDFKLKEELKLYYRASDIFVLMTVGDVWGLVINEAMACGLPIITTNKCMAGLELVEEGENGYIIDVGDDYALTERIKRIVNESNILHQMGKKSIKRIQGYTIEAMAKTHINVFKNILNG